MYISAIVHIFNHIHMIISYDKIRRAAGEITQMRGPDPWLAGDASAPPRMSCAW